MRHVDLIFGSFPKTSAALHKSLWVLFLSAILFSDVVFSESAVPASELVLSAGECSDIEAENPILRQELRELSFKPGVKIEPSDFMKDPRIASFIVAKMKRERDAQQTDWSGLCQYREANAGLKNAEEKPQVVFLGDSITENWIHAAPELFSERVIDRGIGGQTSSQILLRFYPDVVAIGAKLVHVMVGTNDILQNKGPVGDDDIVNNVMAMIDIAQANDIKFVLASILPISVRSWQPELEPAQRIIKLNRRLRDLAAARKIVFVDYFSQLKDRHGGLHEDLGNDGVHPNRAGYALMKPLALKAIAAQCIECQAEIK